MAYIT